MKPELQELIRTARRNQRKASGVPLSGEEKAEEAKESEMEAMRMAMCRLIGIDVAFRLLFEIV